MRKKSIRLEEVAQAPNVIQENTPLYNHIKGKWHSYFGNTNPLIVELGCGKGEYTLALAKRYPKKNFIGIDIKGERLWVGSKAALADSLKNVVFLRINIFFITDFFDKKEVDELYLTFPDPYPNEKDHKRRLVAEGFLKKYISILVSGGTLYLKTDHKGLFGYALKNLKKNGFLLQEVVEDIYHNLPSTNMHCMIQTFYEQKFLKAGIPIHYLSARYN